MASLTVMRAGGVWGAALDHSISIDGQPAARLRPGGAVTLNVEPGPRVVGVDCGGGGPFASSGQAVVRAEPGRSYVVRTFGSLQGQCVARFDPR